jgi:hypothetical protein
MVWVNVAADMPDTTVVADFVKHRQEARNEYPQVAIPYAVRISRLLFKRLGDRCHAASPGLLSAGTPA